MNSLSEHLQELWNICDIESQEPFDKSAKTWRSRMYENINQLTLSDEDKEKLNQHTRKC